MDLLPKAINNLTLSLYKQLAKDQGNVFISPFSISTALSMLLCGAREHTAQEMREVLHFKSVGISDTAVHRCFKELLSVFCMGSEHMTLTFANAILSRKDMPVLSEFKETVEKSYSAQLLEADFVKESEKAVKEINDWVTKNTNGMIKEIIQSLKPSITMVILNAIYFKGMWKYPFCSLSTHPATFYNRGQSSEGKEVPMMFVQRKFRIAMKKTYEALELPYKNDGIVMLLLLPKEINGLQNLEKLLTTHLLKDTLNSLDYFRVDVTVPQLHVEYSKALSETLINLGMVSAFQRSANFSGISPKNMFVSEVLTKSVLIVNEAGTEAAAATAGITVNLSTAINKKFTADHPFLCIIYDEEKDMVLFVGRVIEF